MEFPEGKGGYLGEGGGEGRLKGPKCLMFGIPEGKGDHRKKNPFCGGGGGQWWMDIFLNHSNITWHYTFN